MDVDGREIEFIHWLEFYELADAKMLMKPRITNFAIINWRKPNENEGVLIIVFDQDDYILRKVSSENINE